MAFRGQFSGDASAKHSKVEAILRARYEAVLGVHEVNLHYISGRGYGVTSATRTQATGGAYQPGDRFKLPKPEDISAEVRQILREAGIQVSE